MENSPQAGRLCELLLEQGPGCSWLLDRHLHFLRVFGNALPLFGKPAADLTGAGLLGVLPPAHHDPWRERVERVFGGETLVFRERSASNLPFSITHFPVREDGPEIALAGGTALEISVVETIEQELRNTALNVLKAQDAERARLARFLHDEVGQCLSAAGLQLDLLRMDAESAAPDVPARTREVQQLLESVMERVREFSYELNPAMVERAGLNSALDRMAGRLRRGFPGTLRLMADSSLRIEPPVAEALYKIAEEAVENCLRHADCSLLEVLLKATRNGPMLEVRDNGKGFDTAEVHSRRRGLGLLIMQHCAAEAGIELEISSNRGRGTSIRALVRRGAGPAAEGAV
jgi:signal transduction histidine kinase